MDLPDKDTWPPSKAVPIQRQSEILRLVDKIIELTEEKLDTLKHLRSVLLVGLHYAGKPEEFKVVWSKALMHPLGWRHGVQQRSRIYRKELEQWREEQEKIA